MLKTFSAKTNRVTCTAGGMIVWTITGHEMNGAEAMSAMIQKTCPFVLGSKKRQKDLFWERIRKQDGL